MDNLVHDYYSMPYELLDGEIVYMSPRPSTIHNIAISNISTIFNNYLKGKKCIPFSDGVDVFLDEKNNVIPDFMVVCNSDFVKNAGIYGAPDLVVEVLSPTTAKNDKGYKKKIYGKHGVKEYWIVDTNSKSVEIYLLENGILDLDTIYSIYPDYVLNKMIQEEKDKIVKQFKTSLFDDLLINIEDVFYRID